MIRLAADDDCWPLWEASPGLVGNIDPATLPILSALVQDLLAWSLQFTATLNRENPASSGFPSEIKRLEFAERGRELATRLRGELGPAYNVVQSS